MRYVIDTSVAFKWVVAESLFDPASDAVFLEVFVCDDCLLRKKQLIEEVVVRHTREVVERRTPSF